jgi:hypothetical protein
MNGGTGSKVCMKGGLDSKSKYNCWWRRCLAVWRSIRIYTTVVVAEFETSSFVIIK